MSVYIIAEAGVNHNGSLKTAKRMVDIAKESNVDCIKFQTFISDNIVSVHAKKADYQKLNTVGNESQLEMLKKLELTFDEFMELNEYCNDRQIDFMSTAFDLESIDFLNSLNMNTWKIPSGDITNYPYLKKIAQLNKPIILSTGMSTIDDIRHALEVIRLYHSNQITILHCTTEYPTPLEDVNLKAMDTIQNTFNLPIGYSDHTEGIEVPLAAVARGATVIEKHFTLDKNMDGPDHTASMEPPELSEMVRSIRNIEKALGDGVKKPVQSEMKNMVNARKSIIARKKIKKGEVFNEYNLTVKRPGDGVSPMKWNEIIGKKASRNFDIDELIEL